MNAAARPVRLAVAALTLAACGPAVTSTPIRGPDGQDNWVAITCKHAQVACFAEAGRVCPAGYDLADSEGHVAQESSSYAQVSSAGGFATSRSRTTYSGEMLVHCHGAPAAPLGRECMDDNSCGAGVRCIFGADAGASDTGHCATGNR